MSECGLFWVSEILLWIGGGGRGIILGGWEWVGKYFGLVGVGGMSRGEWG